MFLQPLDLTTALRPSLLQGEALLFVQNAIGLYQGKTKLQGSQDGHAYLTSHRVCYVDDTNPRSNSLAVELKNVDRYEFYAGLFKSSPKITLHPKPPRNHPARTQQAHLNPPTSAGSASSQSSASPSPRATDRATQALAAPPVTLNSLNVTWICPICSFSNPLPPGFEPTTATPNSRILPCQACGIRPSFPHLLKAAITGATGRQARSAESQSPANAIASNPNDILGIRDGPNYQAPQAISSPGSNQCPQCTYFNHPSMHSCEICGTSLTRSGPSTPQSLIPQSEIHHLTSTTSETSMTHTPNDANSSLKLSFHAGGEKVFYERLQAAIVQKKWLLQSAPPIPEPLPQMEKDAARNHEGSDRSSPASKAHHNSVGIAGLERRGFDIRKKNEAVIGSAFEDLEGLMASAKEIIALAESFAQAEGRTSEDDASQLIADSASSLDMITTKEMLGNSRNSDSLYLAELSRNLAEYLTDDAKGVLKKEGGVMTLVDLWAVFNRARGGMELISPADFEKAAQLWEKLKLPVRMRRFKNGLLVVQQADRTDDKTIAQILDWLQKLHESPVQVSEEAVSKKELFGKGVTAQDAAIRFGWGVGVASEELDMAEANGALCRDEGVEGLKYWENWFLECEDEEGQDLVVDGRSLQGKANEEILEALRLTGVL